MIRYFTALILATISISLAAQEKTKSVDVFISELDKRIPQLLEDFIVPGAAIAIFENGEIVLQKGYGYADIKNKIKVTSQTGFNIGSISKTFAAWGVMKLVEEGKLDLDAPAETYLTRWHLPESEFDAEGVTIRRMLSHTAGLSLHGYPGWSPSDKLPTIEESLNGKNNGPGRVELVMEPGTRYQYSGGGYTIMQLIIEEVTGQKFEDYMQAEVLDPLGMKNSSYAIDKKILKKSALEYGPYGDNIDFELFTAQAAAGMHTTLEDFVHMAYASMYRNEDRKEYKAVLSPSSIEQMMQAVPEATGFFGYGMGYQVDDVHGLGLGGHGGNNTGWHALFRVNPETNDGFIVLTNGGGGNTLTYQVYCDWTTWKTGEPLGDWCAAKTPIANTLKLEIDKNGIEGISEFYLKLRDDHPDDYNFEESQLNNLGYYYLGNGDVENALAVFKTNIEGFPDGFNTYDSYGEALLASGKKEEGIENYKKSIRLNPANKHGIQVLNDLGVSTDDLMVTIPIERLKKLTGKYINIDNDEWAIDIEEADGILYANDDNYRFELLPLGDGKFVNADDGASLVFNTKNKYATKLLVMDRHHFTKVK